MKKIAQLAFLWTVMVLAGCSIEPGTHWYGSTASDTGNSPGTGSANSPQQQMTSSVAAQAQWRRDNPGAALGRDQPPAGAVVEITPELVQAQRVERASELPADVASLFAAPKPYTIGPGDVLNIVVWDHPELNLAPVAVTTVGTDYTGSASVASGYSIDAQGILQFAYVGPLKVGGLTELEARDLLTGRLGKYVRDPQITLRIQTYRSRRVFMDGEVRTPGLQIFNDLPMSLPEALNRAGGFTALGDRASIAVIRDGKSVVVNIPKLIAHGINPTRILLKNDDMVRVFAREDSKVFVTGDVSRPATLFLRNGELSLNEALGDTGGVSPANGDARQVFVVRNVVEGKPEIYHLNVVSPGAFALADNFELKAKDMVFVDAAPVVRWSRVISLFLPSTQLIYFGKAAGF
jgi:polysaccharide export outer membrane protein